MTQFVKKLVEGIRKKGLEVKMSSCDNAGEHVYNIMKLCKKEGINLEYTVP